MKRYGIILVFVLSFALTSGLLIKASRAYFGQTAKAQSGITLHAEGRGNPLISLQDGRALETSYIAAGKTQQASQPDRAQALALASGDFDEDGVPDLVVGYNNADAGLLTLHRGNVDAIYSNSPDAKRRKAEGTFSDSAFLSLAIVFDLPQKPDFLGTGDFDADGHLDLVAAARGIAALYLLRGDGQGSFGPFEQIRLEGNVTALETGEINRADGLIDIAVGIAGPNGWQALVFESPEGALRGKPEILSLAAEVTALAVGHLDDDYLMDLAVAAGNDLIIVHGRDGKLSLDETRQALVPPPVIEARSFSFAIVSMSVGDFAGGHQTDIALLSEDGSVHVMARGDDEKQEPKDSAIWQEIGATAVLKSVDTENRARLLDAVKVSSLPHDDLLVIDRIGHQLHILVDDSEAPGKATAAETAASSRSRVAASFDVEGEPMALLPMRLNSDALSDLVVLRSNQLAPTVVQTTPNNTFTVINTNDSGAGSLRQAMDDADASAGADTIDFNIPGTGVHTITPLSPGLPTIGSAVTIDATTQPDFAGLPLIELNGTVAGGTFAEGIDVKSGICLVRGLIINRFGGFGVKVNGSNSVIEGNFIGTDSAGTVALGNALGGILVGNDQASNITIGGTASGARNIISGNGGGGVRISPSQNGNTVCGNFIGLGRLASDVGNEGPGVQIDGASNNIIGGATSGARNMIAANFSVGVYITGNTASGNLVQNNLIGNLLGSAHGNSGGGVLVNSAPNNTIGGTTSSARNIISGNQNGGVNIDGNNATGTLVQGNYVGTSETGTFALGNGEHGVFLIAPDNTIGGTTLGSGNVISGNVSQGVYLDTGASGNFVQGNYIGTDAGGTIDLGNGIHGVLITNSPNNIVGGNLISGNNASGVTISGTSATGNTVEANLIGTQSNGTSGFGNSIHGVFITDSASNNTIGSAAAGNTIAFNGSTGVSVNSSNPNPTGNAISGNSIFSNTGLGIDLSPTGVTPNDFGDVDSGPNNLQNFPVLTSASRSGAYVIIQGFLNSAANASFTIDFYSNDTCDGSGNGEGKTFIGSTTVNTDGIGTAIINATVPNAVPIGQPVTATATDSANNTSEFSQCRTVVISATMIIDTSGDGADSNLNDSVCDDGTGNCTLRAAIEQSNFNSGTNTITFNIPGSGAHTIAPASQLPAITEAANIDGTTQPGFAGAPIIELNGAGAGGTGLTISAGNSTVKGLVINRFAGDGISLSSAGNTIQNNFFGTDLTGNSALGNANGILVSASNNIIGGTAIAERNVISGNSFMGIILSGGSGNQVLGNLIGTNGAGVVALGNGNNGVVISNSGSNVIGGTTAGARNVISGNTQNGVRIAGSGATGNTISGNFIGTDLNGNADLGNALDGVVMEGAPNNTIGGTSSGTRNIISGNGSNGVEINGSDATGNQVQGNFIGTKANGTEALGNSADGVLIFLLGSNNVIGGTIPEARNIISGNSQNGILIDDFASGNTVSGNYVGTDVNGAGALGNLQNGVRIADSSNSNIIGGTSSGAGNLISGNNINGVSMNLTAQGNQVQGNLIGTNATGTADLGNGNTGVVILGAFNTVGGTTTAARNIISGNDSSGIFVNGSSNTISGNFIGTKATGTQALGNGFEGIALLGGSSNVIGGTTVGARNIISGNNGGGVTIFSGASGNALQGNFIGCDVNGNADVGNDGIGVHIVGPNNVIGGGTPASRNIISGNNFHGIQIAGSSATGNTVQSNFIGTDSTGLGALGNSGAGIFIQDVGSPNNNLIGGEAAGNTIAFNGGDGVFATSGTGNTIRGNSIFSNTGLGIDLGTNGVTANDSCDADSGANNLQNFPVLTAAFGSGTSTTIEGTLNSTANTTFTIEFFANTACDASGFGQGKTFIGSTPVTTDASCNASFSVTFEFTTTLGQPITATATDSSNNTSEFSQCVLVTPPSFTVNSIDDGVDSNTADGVCDDGTGHCTLRAAIQQANASSDANTIKFNIPGAGVQTITPVTVLPEITQPVTIDGYTQPGSSPNTNPVGQGLNTVLKIEIKRTGELGDTSFTGLVITAEGCIVRGLVINRFLGTQAIYFQNVRGVVEGNFIGTDATGTVKLANSNGITMNGGLGSMGSTIGGTTPAARNLISGNSGTAVRIGDSVGSASNLVQGNLIGTDVTGTLALGNNGGVTIFGPSSTNNTVGGTAAGSRNVISASGPGVSIGNCSQNIVQGNYLGTDVTGNVALGGSDGVYVENGTGTIIGGSTAAARNVISGNGQHGVTIQSNACIVQGNFIGTNAAGTAPLSNSLGNFYAGISISGSNNMIGGTGSGEGNIIAFNTVGVIVFSPGVGNAILSNSIYESVPRGFFDLSGLGINLLSAGANDLCDADTGANNFQNFPVLTSVTSGGGNTTIQGTLNSTASTTFRIEFFSNPSCDPSGRGEGQNVIGFTSVTTDASCNASFNVTFPVSTAGQVITSTATDASNNTSGFSQCVVCNYALSQTNQFFSASGGADNVNVMCPSGCSWTAMSNDDWITITSGSSGNGNGTVNYSVSGPASSRTGTITIAAQTFTVAQGSTIPPGTYSKVSISSGDTVTLTGDITITGTLTLNGDLNTGAFTLTMPNTASSTGTGDVVGNVKRTGFVIGSAPSSGNPLSFGNPFNTISFDTGTPPTEVTVNLVKSPPAGFSNAVSRTYTITPVGGSGYAATLRLHYLDSELNGNDESTLQLWRNNGTVWSSQGATTRDTTDNWVQLAGVTQFSPWAIAGPSGPTSVDLVSFTARAFDAGVLLEWQTGLEVDNLGFRLYRDEGVVRALVNREMVAGSALTAGLAVGATHSYVWWDNSTSKTAAYWLEDLDLKGRSKWHGPFFAKQTGGKPRTYSQAESLNRLGRLGDAYATHPVEDFGHLVEASQSSTSPVSLQHAGLASGRAVKIGVRRAGWYRVSQAELINAALDPKTDPRTLRLFVDGLELPIFVAGEDDGRFDATDSVEFYGLGLNTPSTDTRVYWLVSGAQPGLRINKTAFAKGYPSGESFAYTVERRDRTIYFSALKNGDEENFFGAVVTGNPLEQGLTLNNLTQSAKESALIEVSLQGVTSLPHQVSVALNGSSIGSVVFNGQSKGQQKIEVSQAMLRDGENLITLQSINGPSDISLVDSIRITYQHTYRAENDSLGFMAKTGETATINGFSAKDIRVFDVTDERNVQEVGVSIDQTKDGYSATVTASAASVSAPGVGERKLLALSEDKALPAANIKPNSPSSLRQSTNAADFIIISHSSLLDSLKRLVDFRRKQGLITALVDIEDVYDEFSFGNKSPQSIKDFLSYAAASRKLRPQFVLFAGDASYDAKNYLGLGDNDLVPTKLIDTSFLETASDDWLADFTGDGIADLSIGRLPVRTAQEASTVVSKIIAYGKSAPSNEVAVVADRNDGFDFEQASTGLRPLIPSSIRVSEIFRSRSDDSTARSQLLDAINRGQKIVNYTGHGSVNVWRGNLLTATDGQLFTNRDRLSLFVMMTCLNGYFQDAMNESLGESLLKSDSGGAIAVWASSGMTFPQEQALLNQELYRLLFSSNRRVLTLGEIMRKAKATVKDLDVRRSWILLGDPTIKLK